MEALVPVPAEGSREEYDAIVAQTRVWLAEARSIRAIKEIRDRAEAFRSYLRKRDYSLEAQNAFAELKLRAERRAGELLECDGRGQGQRDQTFHEETFAVPKLDELGVSRLQSHRWQKVATVPEAVFESYAATRGEEELTTAGLLKAAAAARNGVHFSSDTPEWVTPAEVIRCVLDVLGSIDLDPCSNTGQPNIPAVRYHTEIDNGLAQPWSGRVYMNPPYGRTIGDWVEALVDRYLSGNVTEAIALLPARTDTAWFRLLRDFPRCFILGRLKFSGQENCAPFPSMVVYLGPNVARFVHVFDALGDSYARMEATHLEDF